MTHLATRTVSFEDPPAVLVLPNSYVTGLTGEAVRRLINCAG